MRIALNYRVIKYSGIGAYTKYLAEGYMRLGQEVFLYDDILDSSDNGLRKYINTIKRVIKDITMLSKWLKNHSIDLYHVPKNTGVPFFSPVPVVVTIHDVIPHVFPKQYFKNDFERLYYELSIKHSITKSKKIITVSEFSKKEIINAYGVDASKIAVVLNAYNSAFKLIEDSSFLEAVRKKYNLKEKYILALGGSEYRKNIQRLIRVYIAHFSQTYQLVVIGGKWRDVDLSRQFASEKNIYFLTNVPEEDLVAIYNMATVFVFPSFYEGFGIPVLEGMACGVPVVTSNVSSIPEVGGDAAVYFNPYDEDDMAAKIHNVLEDEFLQKKMVARGLEKIKEYSWDKCAKETLQVYEEVLNSK